MDADRARRDELESLQGENRQVQAELAVEQAPAYFAALATLEATAKALADGATKARAHRDRARQTRRETEARVVAVQEQLRIEQQRRLGLALLAIPLLLWVLATQLHALGDGTQVLAPVCAALVALLLAPRARRWFATSEGVTKTGLRAWVRTNVLQNVGLLPFGVVLLALLVPPWLLASSALREAAPVLPLEQLTQVLAALAVLLSVRGVRRADAGLGTNRRLALAAGVVGFFPLALVTLGGYAIFANSDLRYLLTRWPGGMRATLLASADTLALLVAGPTLLLWRLDALRDAGARRPWAWPLAALCFLAATAFAWALLGRPAALMDSLRFDGGSSRNAAAATAWLLGGAALWAWTAWRAQRRAPAAAPA